jgi:hypothetical protein
MEASPLTLRVNGGAVYPVPGTDGVTHLAFSATISNVSSFPVTIRSIEVVDAATQKSFGRSQVETTTGADVTLKPVLFSKPAGVDDQNFSATLPPGVGGAIYFDIALGPASAPPAWLAVRVASSMDLGSGKTKDTSFTGTAAPVSCDPVTVLSPPLKGGNWVNANGCCKIVTPHRWVLLPMSGQLRPAEQFAIDFVRLDEENRLYQGEQDRLESYAYYGVDVVSAALGRVVEVVDGLPDGVPGKDPPVVEVDTAAGNHVIVQMRPDRYALYAHLKPGSIVVKVGDKVVRGAKIGSLGNSGNSDAPHLHFQLMDRPSALDADGIPFVFRDFRHAGTVKGGFSAMIDTLTKGERAEIDRAPQGEKTAVMPLVQDVTDFP